MLELRNVSVRYGGHLAVDDVSFTLGPGITGLIGPNGAGKTTLVDAITGFVAAEGQVLLDGRRMDGLPPYRRALGGLARTFQSAELFSQLTVAENVRVAIERPTWLGLIGDAVRPNRSKASARVNDALELVGLADVADRRPTELGFGQRRLVGVARALALDAKVVLLDEPAAGLDLSESELMEGHLASVARDGVSILLVEHDMRLVFAACDAVHVLVTGKLVASGTAEEVRRNEAVVAAYLGSSAALEAHHEDEPA